MTTDLSRVQRFDKMTGRSVNFSGRPWPEDEDTHWKGITGRMNIGRNPNYRQKDITTGTGTHHVKVCEREKATTASAHRHGLGSFNFGPGRVHSWARRSCSKFRVKQQRLPGTQTSYLTPRLLLLLSAVLTRVRRRGEKVQGWVEDPAAWAPNPLAQPRANTE